jgi:hypothetical protein
MGCGASRHASTQTDHNGTQLKHSKLRSNRSSVEPLALHQQAVSARKNRHSQDESEWALPVQQKRHAHEDLDWPLPLDEVYPRFQLNDNDSGRYSLTPLSPRVSFTFILLSKYIVHKDIVYGLISLEYESR